MRLQQTTPQTPPKRVAFKPNTAGFRYIDIDMQRWVIVASCAEMTGLRNRACRITKRGQRVEYRSGSGYVEINADVESIG